MFCDKCVNHTIEVRLLSVFIDVNGGKAFTLFNLVVFGIDVFLDETYAIIVLKSWRGGKPLYEL